ncbi:hypothetical protein [Rhodanobacter sp. B05]|uniref:hypothetical protein n=1 Tax=Rhodanobacter sp. B05 TaxID=1945859 RepID=UPI0011154EA6|nr:hypothetical protein [Rhodanobacter sp. B05]
MPKSTDSRTPKIFAQPTYLGSLLGMFLLSMLYAFPAYSQCVHWYHAAGEKFNNGLDGPSNLRIFSGNVGNQQIRMSLHYDVAANSIDGFYGYNNQPGTLTIHGKMRSSGAGMDLVERDAQGKTTGYFSLLFTYPTGPGYDAAGVQKHVSDYDCSYVTGTWHSASDSHPIKVKLYSSGEQTPAEQQARESNDEAAYKVQKALLSNDRKEFASALKYPFCTSRYRVGVTWWKSPHDVIAHYKQIAILADPLSLRPAVPHAIETVGKLSYWIGDTMEFENGKMQAMCDASCFHSECYHP